MERTGATVLLRQPQPAPGGMPCMYVNRPYTISQQPATLAPSYALLFRASPFHAIVCYPVSHPLFPAGPSKAEIYPYTARLMLK